MTPIKENLLHSKHYFIDLINSTKANKMTELYHYSGIGFKNSKINLGVYRRSDDLLVGVLQWGVSAADNIRLDRYVKNPIKKEEYLELNRFSMADSEGKNSESEAISLGIKWIKKNRPDIRLLVSYAGRKEGNYGYIYQATNWEYLGYFISPGFWFLDGAERHQTTAFYHAKTQEPLLPMTEALTKIYKDVRQTWTKQFIYIQRLDPTLTPAVAPLPYPKATTEYPICTRIKILVQDDEVFNKFEAPRAQEVKYYYEEETQLFTRRALARRGELNTVQKGVAVYDRNGTLQETYPSAHLLSIKKKIPRASLRLALQNGNLYKDCFFQPYVLAEEPPAQLEVNYLCKIDGKIFHTQVEVGNYLGVTRQAVNSAISRGAKTIKGKLIEWKENGK